MITSKKPKDIIKEFKLDGANSNVIIIDIRETVEYEHEHIPNSINLPIKQLLSKNLSAYKDKTAIFHCKSGNRTTLNQEIIERTPFANKYCIEGGLEAWKQSGLEIEKMTSAPIDIMRQVQLIVGIMILSGLILAKLLSSYFLILPLLAGVGMSIAGTTGFCGMAKILLYAPWNRAAKAKQQDLCASHL